MIIKSNHHIHSIKLNRKNQIKINLNRLRLLRIRRMAISFFKTQYNK